MTNFRTMHAQFDASSGGIGTSLGGGGTIGENYTFRKFEDISRENNSILKQVHETICDLRTDCDDKLSYIKENE